MKNFSYYPGPANNIFPSKEVDLKIVAELLRSDESLQILTSELRGLNDEEAQKAFKKERLPYVTFSGTFAKRSDDGLVSHSGLICIDLDNIGRNGEINEIKERIKRQCEPALMFISPRGNGLKIVFAVDINEGEHSEYFSALSTFLNTGLNVPAESLDKAAKAISQACFLCSDPQVYYSDNPTLFNRVFLTKYQSTMIENGDCKDEDTALFELAKKWVDNKEHFISGNRNHYITVLADACNRYGVGQEYTLKQLESLACDGFTVTEITSTVKSRYSHKEWHGMVKDIVHSNPVDVSSIAAYIRVGTNFFKIIRRLDRYGILETYLKSWTKDTLVQDYGRKFLRAIPKFDDFAMVPNNLNYRSVIGNCYNLYQPFSHVPSQGKFIWTERLLRHVFGDQYELGIRYMQILYMHPERSTIILVLVSKERGTGKTTILNWINMLFGTNVALISSTDFMGAFNGHYATKNIICIEETLFEKNLTIEKLKALTTQKFIQVNEKYVQPYKIPFYGKIIMTSNNEDRFAKIDKEEIRFLVRKLKAPEFKNHDIEKNLLEEIPAFLNYLQSLPPVDWSVSRSGFTAEELKNNSLDAVVEESKSGLYKDLEMEITDFFENNDLESFKATPKDLKKNFFQYDYQVTLNYLRRVLKEDFGLLPQEPQRYQPFEEDSVAAKTGRPYCFYRDRFINKQTEDPPF